MNLQEEIQQIASQLKQDPNNEELQLLLANKQKTYRAYLALNHMLPLEEIETTEEKQIEKFILEMESRPVIIQQQIEQLEKELKGLKERLKIAELNNKLSAEQKRILVENALKQLQL